VFPSEDIGR